MADDTYVSKILKFLIDFWNSTFASFMTFEMTSSYGFSKIKQ